MNKSTSKKKQQQQQLNKQISKIKANNFKIEAIGKNLKHASIIEYCLHRCNDSSSIIQRTKFLLNEVDNLMADLQRKTRTVLIGKSGISITPLTSTIIVSQLNFSSSQYEIEDFLRALRFPCCRASTHLNSYRTRAYWQQFI